ncbi:MAG: hypothetical protein AAF490_22005 [Chloroflexota bacterium]
MTEDSNGKSFLLAPIEILPPTESEEIRQLIEVVANQWKIIEILVENANWFVPGEFAEEFQQAWKDSSASMLKIVVRLEELYSFSITNTSAEFNPQLRPNSTIDDEYFYAGNKETKEAIEGLKKAGLTGKIGQLKKAIQRNLIDKFLKFWKEEPRSKEKRKGAINAAIEFLEGTTTFIGSIPGGEVLVELLSFSKQLIEVRKDREQ